MRRESLYIIFFPFFVNLRQKHVNLDFSCLKVEKETTEIKNIGPYILCL